MKKTTIAIISAVIIIIVALGIYFIATKFWNKPNPTLDQNVTPLATPSTSGEGTGVATGTQVQDTNPGQSVLGTSIEGRDITAYHYGTGATELLFVGGIHGGYEWNTSLVAYQLMDYLTANPSVIPANVKVSVIPVLNPDGLNKVVGTSGRFTAADVSTSQDTVVAGRFNSINVDLNRNFDCDWKASGTWQNKTVSGGTSAFSEPESQAIKNYVDTNKPAAVIVWFSAAGGVYSSSCDNGISTETAAITKAFAAASGYPAHQSFNSYATTGDMTNWLAKENIPAISVLLTNHTDTEWDKNQAGILALFKYYTK